LFSALTSLKEKALEAAAGALLNERIKTFGLVRTLAIDSQRKTIRLEVELKGEPTPITLVVDAYELSREGDETYITIQRASASREWITCVANQYVVGRKFRIPKAARIGL